MTNARSFRKKPVVIQAIQWDGTLSGLDDILSVFPDIRTVAKTSHPPTNKCSCWKIGTLEGSHEVSAGDFIIRGVKGEYYPCKPDVFAMTYDPEPAALPAQPAVPDDVGICPACGTDIVLTHAVIMRQHKNESASQRKEE